jgi:L-ascorbate metabolism protein UlaG (beta-lactamase superfamily)
MKRRELLQYSGAGLMAALGTGLLANTSQAQSGGVDLQFLGHSCFLFTGGGQRILVNPFRSAGCTAGLPTPRVNANLVMISSQILDEGAIDVLPGNPKLLYEAGAYEIGGLRVQGITMDHDRNGGRRFGTNVAWRWNQGGITVLHLGGAASPVSIEQKILIGSPDVVCIPIGGGAKTYTPAEAQAALKIINPKVVIPMQYRTGAAAKDQCDLGGLDEFLKLMAGTPVRRGGSSFGLSKGDLPKDGMVIQVMGG